MSATRLSTSTRRAESRAYLEQFAGTPRYFTQTAPVRSADDALERLQADDISLVIEMPPNFGRDLRKSPKARSPGAGRRRQHFSRRNRLAICSSRAG